jgi:hypothetical protein
VVDPEMGKGQMLDGELCVIALPKRQIALLPEGFLEPNPIEVSGRCDMHRACVT